LLANLSKVTSLRESFGTLIKRCMNEKIFVVYFVVYFEALKMICYYEDDSLQEKRKFILSLIPMSLAQLSQGIVKKSCQIKLTINILVID
jgi:hypothetical protein